MEDRHPLALSETDEKRLEVVVTDGRSTIDLEEGWALVRDKGIDVIARCMDAGLEKVGKPFGTKGGIFLYSIAHKAMASVTDRSSLLQKYEEVLTDSLERYAKPALAEKEGEALVLEFARRWEDHKLLLKWSYKLLFFLDQRVTGVSSRSQSVDSPPLATIGLEVFDRFLFRSMAGHMRSSLVSMWNQGRRGEGVDLGKLGLATEVLLWMGVVRRRRNIKSVEALKKATVTEEDHQVYIDFFETHFIEETVRYCEGLAAEWLGLRTVEYLQKAEQFIEAERENAKKYLHRRTWEPLEAALQQKLLVDVQQDLFYREGDGIAWIIVNSRQDDIALMYRVFQAVPGALESVAKLFGDHVLKEGTAVLEARRARLVAREEAAKKKGKKAKPSATDHELVIGLIECTTKYDKLVQEALDSDARFQKAVETAHRAYVNQDTPNDAQNAQFIARFVDAVLRGSIGKERLDAKAVDARCRQAMALFEYIRDKDTFGEEHRSLMAKRLLSRKSVSDDAEQAVISAMKLSVGAQFTSKLDGIITDLHSTKATSDKFRETGKLKGTTAEDVDFNALVLTTGNWPQYSLFDCRLPESMAVAAASFREHYCSLNGSRKLKWVLTQGSAEVRFRADSRTFRLQVHTAQAMVLLHMEECPEGATLADLKARTNMPDDALEKTLHSLACNPRNVILTKVPAGNKISAGDKFSINAGFKNKAVSISVPMRDLETNKTKEKVREDRSHAIQAAIVRVMKARKRLKQDQLVPEVLTQLRAFEPDLRLIKRNIETLIEREYLERDDSDHALLNYLA